MDITTTERRGTRMLSDHAERIQALAISLGDFEACFARAVWVLRRCAMVLFFSPSPLPF